MLLSETYCRFDLKALREFSQREVREVSEPASLPCLKLLLCLSS